MLSRTQVIVLVVAGACVPALVLRVTGSHLGTVADTGIYGLAIVAAAFLLAWAAEAAEVDISQGLAVAFIALIAVLPEYAVDLTFAWKAGQDPSFAPFAVANMTGANRLLIGLGWPLIFFLFWLRTRKRLLRLERGHSIEVAALGLSTVYSFSIAAKGSITLIDTIVLSAIFVVYIIAVARVPSEEPELVGPARSIGSLPTLQRRSVIALLFVYAAVAIVASAEPFAEGLVHTGTELGIDEFLLVQWLAPLASEAPEFLVASILALRGRAAVAMGALLSSKVNQWTLLLGGIPVAFGLSSKSLEGLQLDGRQQEEVLLTAAQSLFAVAIFLNLSLSTREALALVIPFMVSLVIPVTEIRVIISVGYIIVALGILVQSRMDLLALVRNAVSAARHPESLAEPELVDGP